MGIQADEDEHSIEMHLPYVRKMFEGLVILSNMIHLYSQIFHRKDIRIVPIVVGSISERVEASFGSILSPYLASDDTFFVISSDFCHW